MTRRYKTSYTGRRGLKRFAVAFGAKPDRPTRAESCLSCGDGIEEVMTVSYCFHCWNQPERVAERAMIARREAIYAGLALVPPLPNDEILSLYAELAEINHKLGETEGTHPSPIISGGEVLETTPQQSSMSDDDMPF